MIYDGIMNFIGLATTYVLMISVHELGHKLTWDSYRKEPVDLLFTKKRIIVGSQKDIEKLTSGQYINVMLFGILAGLIPLGLVNFGWDLPLMWLLVIPYLWGCRDDFRGIIEEMKK